MTLKRDKISKNLVYIVKKVKKNYQKYSDENFVFYKIVKKNIWNSNTFLSNFEDFHKLHFLISLKIVDLLESILKLN